MTDRICYFLGTSRGITFFTPKIRAPQVKQYIKRFRNNLPSFINIQKSQQISLNLRNIVLQFISSIHAKKYNILFIL
jgi:hypothetical protein